MTKSNEAHSVEQSQADATLAELGLNYPCTDVGNMERFIDQHEDKVRFIPERKAWALWDGTRWKITGGSTVFELALQTAKNIYDEARDCPMEEGRKRLTNWALLSQASYRVQNMTHMAAKHPRLVEGIDAFDTDPLKLNSLNGVVDLRSGELIERSPQDKVMKLAPVAYRRHAQCPRFNRFLHEIFNDDQDLIAFIQRTIGYTITGATTEQVFFLAYGTGANGKSTLFETILDIVGDYGRASEFDTFLSNERGNTRVMEGVAKLQGKRFALASETDSCRRFSEALIKKVTGGDTVTGSFLYGSSFEFRPEFKLWLLANHLPIAKDGSYGFWRRVKVIPFARRFNASGLDQNLRAALQEEEEGILAWCVRGAMNWIKMLDETNGSSGLGSCSAVDNAVADYKDDHDTFGKFIEECLVESPGNEIPAAVLYTAYQEWCTVVGETNPCSQVIFGSRLAERSIPRKRKKSGNVYTDYLLSKPVLVPQGYDDF